MSKRKGTGPREDLVGKRFGKLVVTSLAGKQEYPSGDSKYLWNCVCDCGNTTTPTGNSLKRANTTSCRKCIYEDLSGEVFGKLTVISRVQGVTSQITGKQIVMWSCACSCGNTHVVSSGNLNRGNVKSCGCLFDDIQGEDLVSRKEIFLVKANEIHSNKYLYDLSGFLNTSSSIVITCPLHGEFTQAVRDHIIGCGCQKCASENRAVGLDEFISRGIKNFGDKYDYSLVEYANNSTKVIIVCPEHGPFEQLAASHMNSSGCFECSANLRHWNYKVYCARSPEFANTIGKLYLVKLTNQVESFLKVGVSVGFSNRLAKYRQDGFDVDVLKTYDDLAINIAERESELLSFIKSNNIKYIPLTKFSGRTECAVLEAENLIKERM